MQKKYLLSMLFIASLLTGRASSEPLTDAANQTGKMLTLSGAVQLAVEGSPRLKSANARLDAASGAEEQAGYWSNPEVQFDAENVAGNGQYKNADSAEYTYAISQKIELGGKREARKKAARSMREAAFSALLAERLNLERDVYVAYSEVVAEAEAVKLTIEQEQLAKEVLSTVTERVEVAAEPEIQQSKAEVAYSTSVIAHDQREQQLQVAKKKLARLWGASLLNATLDNRYFFELKAVAPFASYQEKLSNIPDMQRFAYIKAEKEARLQLERAAVVPDPNFSIGIRDLRATNNQAVVFSVSMPIPLLNQNSGNVRKAQAELTQSENDAWQARLLLEQQLAENWQNWKKAYATANQLKTKLLPAAEKAFKLARSGYEKGRFMYLEVLDAQRTLFNARAEYNNVLKRYHIARANVERLTTETGEKK